MAIYHPGVNAQGTIGFNIGGSQGHWSHDLVEGDAYRYYTWLPNVPDEPFEDPVGNGEPGWWNLNNSEYFAVLNFVDGTNRLEMDVPVVNPLDITLDAQMNEVVWQNAAEASLVSSTGHNFWINYYGREPRHDKFSFF